MWLIDYTDHCTHFSRVKVSSRESWAPQVSEYQFETMSQNKENCLDFTCLLQWVKSLMWRKFWLLCVLLLTTGQHQLKVGWMNKDMEFASLMPKEIIRTECWSTKVSANLEMWKHSFSISHKRFLQRSLTTLKKAAKNIPERLLNPGKEAVEAAMRESMAGQGLGWLTATPFWKDNASVVQGCCREGHFFPWGLLSKNLF